MKKFLKSLKQVLLSEEELTSQRGHDNQPKVQQSVEQKETATPASTGAKHSRNVTRPPGGPLTAQSEDAIQTDEAKCSSQRQFPFRKTGNFLDRRLFLGGLPDNIPEEKVRKVFESYGKVVNVYIPLDKEKNKRKRYGFLEFESEESAKACLEDHFVVVGERRVEVHKAWPKSTFKREESADGKETKETDDSKKFSFLFGDRQSSLESLSCSGSESNAANSQLTYQKLFEDYFKAKIFLENSLGLASFSFGQEDKKREEDEKEMEKILRGLYVTAEDSSEEDEDDEDDDFSGDIEGTHSTVEEFESCFRDSTGVTSSDQRALIRDEKRICNLCKWAPLDNSVEGFLAHCRTPAHRQKLKERFQKSATPDNPQTKECAKSDDQKNLQYKKTKHEKVRRKQPSKKENKSVLEEIMSSVEAKTEKCIKCKICNKTVPPAADIRILMANLSHHIQSKGHLAKISELEKSRANPEENGAEKKRAHAGKTPKSSKNGPNNKNLPETTNQPKKETSIKTNKGPYCESESVPKPNASASLPKTKFRCLLCNYFCSVINTFANHLTSESHLAKDEQNSSSLLKTASLESFSSNLHKCLNCDTFLYGCPDSIKNHCVKCKKPVVLTRK